MVGWPFSSGQGPTALHIKATVFGLSGGEKTRGGNQVVGRGMVGKVREEMEQE